MKRLITLSALALLLGIITAIPCSGPNSENLALGTNTTQYVYWDFTDCTFGVTYFTISITKPDGHALAPSVPLAISAINLTTGEVAVSYAPFGLTFGASNEGLGMIQLTLTYSGSKPLDVLVSTSENFGGPP